MTAADIPLQNDVEEHCRKEGGRERLSPLLVGQTDLPIRDMPSLQVFEKIILQMITYSKFGYSYYIQRILFRLL